MRPPLKHIFIFTLALFAFFSVYSVIKLYPLTAYLLGLRRPTSYIVLLQNDTEIRPNGGFAGSYAKITASCKIGQLVNPLLCLKLEFQDIYVPNGQLKSYVKPPNPIQTAFGHGTWQLANADWDPHFPSSATSIRWFFTKGGETNPDVLATLSLTDVKKIASIVGPFRVDALNLTVAPDNLYQLLQNQAEFNFFPGSTQKKDALTATGKAFSQKISATKLSKKIKIFFLLIDSLNKQNLLLNSSNKTIQSQIEDLGWSGSFLFPPCRQRDCLVDSFATVETNLGSNKANCCLARDTKHEIQINSQKITHQVTITLTNNSPNSNPTPPTDYSGDYLDYLRIYLSPTASNIIIDPDPGEKSDFVIDYQNGFTQVGFFHRVNHLSKQTIKISYTLDRSFQTNYQLNIFKQHGLTSSPQEITVNHKKFTTQLTQDFAKSFKI